jgi:UvrB domain 3
VQRRAEGGHRRRAVDAAGVCRVEAAGHARHQTGFGERVFAVDEQNEYQILLVANKFQTGFDQPLLVAMYVDKRLSGAAAAQTLSRLNRVAPGKDQTFVLDFANTAEDIGPPLDDAQRRDLAEKVGYGSATTPPGDLTSPTQQTPRVSPNPSSWQGEL